MKVTTPQANRIYNFLKGLWVQKDLNWIPSVKAAPVKTGKSVTWIRDALVGVGIIQNVFNKQKLLILLERLWRGPVVAYCSKPISKVQSGTGFTNFIRCYGDVWNDISGRSRHQTYQRDQPINWLVIIIIPEISGGTWHHLNWYHLTVAYHTPSNWLQGTYHIWK